MNILVCNLITRKYVICSYFCCRSVFKVILCLKNIESINLYLLKGVVIGGREQNLKTPAQPSAIS